MPTELIPSYLAYRVLTIRLEITIKIIAQYHNNGCIIINQNLISYNVFTHNVILIFDSYTYPLSLRSPTTLFNFFFLL